MGRGRHGDLRGPGSRRGAEDLSRVLCPVGRWWWGRGPDPASPAGASYAGSVLQARFAAASSTNKHSAKEEACLKIISGAEKSKERVNTCSSKILSPPVSPTSC